MFASCANSSDSNSDNNDGNNTGITDNNNDSNNSNSGENNSNNSNSNGNNGGNNNNNNNNGDPSPSLPADVGENPIKETIKLNRDGSNHRYLELRTDGTALQIYIDNYDKSKETEAVFKYSYDNEKEIITMKLEKYYYGGFFGEEELQLLTYNELCSKIDKEFTVEKFREAQREYYEERKDDERFKEDYPDCDTYEKYEVAIVKESGFDSFADAVEYEKQIYKNNYKAMFGAQIIYAYKIDDGKITLTEKFTGVKNMVDSECYFSDESGYCYIYSFGASIRFIEDDSRYSGAVNTDKKTISFVSEKDRKEKVTATYTENIDAETVTIKFNDNEYVCKFEGEVYTQVE